MLVGCDPTSVTGRCWRGGRWSRRRAGRLRRILYGTRRRGRLGIRWRTRPRAGIPRIGRSISVATAAAVPTPLPIKVIVSSAPATTPIVILTIPWRRRRPERVLSAGRPGFELRADQAGRKEENGERNQCFSHRHRNKLFGFSQSSMTREGPHSLWITVSCQETIIITNKCY